MLIITTTRLCSKLGHLSQRDFLSSLPPSFLPFVRTTPNFQGSDHRPHFLLRLSLQTARLSPRIHQHTSPTPLISQLALIKVVKDDDTTRTNTALLSLNIQGVCIPPPPLCHQPTMWLRGDTVDETRQRRVGVVVVMSKLAHPVIFNAAGIEQSTLNGRCRRSSSVSVYFTNQFKYKQHSIKVRL